MLQPSISALMAAFAVTVFVVGQVFAEQPHVGGSIHTSSNDQVAAVSKFRQSMDSVRASIFDLPTSTQSHLSGNTNPPETQDSSSATATDGTKHVAAERFDMSELVSSISAAQATENDPEITRFWPWTKRDERAAAAPTVTEGPKPVGKRFDMGELVSSISAAQATESDPEITRFWPWTKREDSDTMTVKKPRIGEVKGIPIPIGGEPHIAKYSSIDSVDNSDASDSDSLLVDFAMSHPESTLSTAVLPRSAPQPPEADTTESAASDGDLERHRKPVALPEPSGAGHNHASATAAPTKTFKSQAAHATSTRATVTSSAGHGNTHSRKDPGSSHASSASGSTCKKTTAKQCAVVCPTASVGGQGGSHASAEQSSRNLLKRTGEKPTTPRTIGHHQSASGGKCSTTCSTTTGCGVKPTTTTAGSAGSAGGHACPRNVEAFGGEDAPFDYSYLRGSGANAAKTGSGSGSAAQGSGALASGGVASGGPGGAPAATGYYSNSTGHGSDRNDSNGEGGSGNNNGGGGIVEY